jgi:hypothetical protein
MSNVIGINTEAPVKTACKFVWLCLLFSGLSLIATAQVSVDAGQTKVNVFESTYFHFHYELPKGWFALDDGVRLADNKKRYETQLEEVYKDKGPNTPTQKTEVYPPFTLLIASRTPVTSSETGQLPRVLVQAIRRFPTMMEAGDPANLVSRMKPKVLRGPEDIILSGHKFVRTDFQFRADSFLSKFTTASGDYLIGFDLRADNEKDLSDLAASMQSIRFSER